MKNNRREVEALKQIEKAKAAVDVARRRLDEARQNRTIECACCLKRARVTRWRVFQKQWYEGPHGCMGGDTWHDGEKDILCPNCGVWNRLIFKVGKRIAKKYAVYMVRNDPYRGDDVPGKWVNL